MPVEWSIDSFMKLALDDLNSKRQRQLISIARQSHLKPLVKPKRAVAAQKHSMQQMPRERRFNWHKSLHWLRISIRHGRAGRVAGLQLQLLLQDPAAFFQHSRFAQAGHARAHSQSNGSRIECSCLVSWNGHQQVNVSYSSRWSSRVISKSIRLVQMDEAAHA